MLETACDARGAACGVANAAQLRCALVDGASAVVRCAAGDPLKILVPRPRGAAVWAYTATYGGGLLAGDRVGLEVDLAPGARCLLGTQASTKIYVSSNGRTARQELRARLAEGSLLACLPDPVTCFAGARYDQRQRFALEPSASLALVDWVSAGRCARGERWAADAYHTSMRIERAGRLVLVDALRLGGDAGQRLGDCEVLATAVLVGPALAEAAAAILAFVAKRPAAAHDDVLLTASPLGDGVILRCAGAAVEPVALALRALLAPALTPLLGGDPWERRN